MRVSPLALLGVAFAGGALSMWGLLWDTAWHRTLARDTFWSPPHLCVYVGGIVVWSAAIAAIILATRGRLSDLGGPVLRVGRLRLPFGFLLTALGVLQVIAAAPFDAWFHAVYGKDVLIWSPPHAMGQTGGAVAAAGLLFATAAQCGRGVMARRALWTVAVCLPAVHIIHVAHYILAHYVMVPATRTPDFYPLLIAVMFTPVLVALARVAGPVAPVLAAALFFAASVIVDQVLAITGFARYTLTPVVAVPALAIAALYAVARRAAARPSLGVAAGALFAVVVVAIETWWMARIVAQPWPRDAVMRAFPATLLAGAVGGFVGWAWGGFLLASKSSGGAVEVFGSRSRARVAAALAIVLFVSSIVALYRPQVYGPPMRVEEFALAPTPRVTVQEAVFWEPLLDEEFGIAPEVAARSEGIIDGIPLHIGPAWCARDAAQLEHELTALDFALSINGAPVDLTRYPLVRERLHDGRACGWVGVLSRRQRASQNRFVYTITPRAGTTLVRATRVEVFVVFKDP